MAIPKKMLKVINYSKKINDGGSADVYTWGKTRVLRFSYYDAAYLDYAQEVFDGTWGDNPHAPRIYAIHQVDPDCMDDFTSSSSNVVIIERLESIEDMDVGEIWKDNWNCEITSSPAALCERYWIAEPERHLITEDLLDLHNDLINMAEDYGHCNDIHELNVMLRPANTRRPDQLVITDPWC